MQASSICTSSQPQWPLEAQGEKKNPAAMEKLHIKY